MPDTTPADSAGISAAIDLVRCTVGYKLNGTPNTRAERLALFQRGIDLAAASGTRSSFTAEQYDALLFPTAAPDMNAN
jgi:hypothetical protein